MSSQRGQLDPYIMPERKTGPMYHVREKDLTRTSCQRGKLDPYVTLLKTTWHLCHAREDDLMLSNRKRQDRNLFFAAAAEIVRNFEAGRVLPWLWPVFHSRKSISKLENPLPCDEASFLPYWAGHISGNRQTCYVLRSSGEALPARRCPHRHRSPCLLHQGISLPFSTTAMLCICALETQRSSSLFHGTFWSICISAVLCVSPGLTHSLNGNCCYSTAMPSQIQRSLSSGILLFALFCTFGHIWATVPSPGILWRGKIYWLFLGCTILHLDFHISEHRCCANLCRVVSIVLIGLLLCSWISTSLRSFFLLIASEISPMHHHALSGDVLA